MQRAKIFKNGQSEAVRIPKEYRFNTKEVVVIPLGNSVILRPVLNTWQEVFDSIKQTDDFLSDGIDKLPDDKRKWELFK